MSLTKTRFAPTPSGFLHLGNVCNLLLTHCYSKALKLHFQLRIDDIDRSRFRVIYLEDVFRVCEYLGISFDSGPSDIVSFKKTFSQAHQLEKYRSFIDKLKGHSFLCECSRKDLQGAGLTYPGYCRKKNLTKGSHLKTRLNVSAQGPFCITSPDDKKSFILSDTVGDFILWNHLEDRPSYQLVSFVEDFEQKIDLIIRGDDLLNSTLSQEVIKRLIFPGADHSSITYHHHRLIKENNQKLSKSVRKNSGGSLIQDHLKSHLYSYFWNWLFGEDKVIHSINELGLLFEEKVEALPLERVSY